MSSLYRLSCSRFVAGVVVDDEGFIREAAPILRWALGRKIWSVVRTGWSVELVTEGVAAPLHLAGPGPAAYK